MSTQTAPTGPPGSPAAGQWRPTDPHRRRTPKQAKRELRKDLKRRRRILERARHDPTLTDFEVRVLAGLLFHSDGSAGRVWPKVPTVAGEVHGHPRSVRRCVAQLEVGGYVKRIMRPVPGHKNLSNLYYFCEPTGPVPAQRVDQRRRPRHRRPDRGTAGTAGTPKGLNQPSQPAAPTPVTPPHRPEWPRDPLPQRQIPNHPPLRVPTPTPPPPTNTEKQAAAHALDHARAILRATNPKPGRP